MGLPNNLIVTEQAVGRDSLPDKIDPLTAGKETRLALKKLFADTVANRHHEKFFTTPS